MGATSLTSRPAREHFWAEANQLRRAENDQLVRLVQRPSTRDSTASNLRQQTILGRPARPARLLATARPFGVPRSRVRTPSPESAASMFKHCSGGRIGHWSSWADDRRRLSSASTKDWESAWPSKLVSASWPSPSQSTASPAPVSLKKCCGGIRRLAIGSAGMTVTRASTRPQAAPSEPNNPLRSRGTRRHANAHMEERLSSGQRSLVLRIRNAVDW